MYKRRRHLLLKKIYKHYHGIIRIMTFIRKPIYMVIYTHTAQHKRVY